MVYERSFWAQQLRMRSLFDEERGKKSHPHFLLQSLPHVPLAQATLHRPAWRAKPKLASKMKDEKNHLVERAFKKNESQGLEVRPILNITPTLLHLDAFDNGAASVAPEYTTSVAPASGLYCPVSVPNTVCREMEVGINLVPSSRCSGFLSLPMARISCLTFLGSRISPMRKHLELSEGALHGSPLLPISSLSL